MSDAANYNAHIRNQSKDSSPELSGRRWQGCKCNFQNTLLDIKTPQQIIYNNNIYHLV